MGSLQVENGLMARTRLFLLLRQSLEDPCSKYFVGGWGRSSEWILFMTQVRTKMVHFFLFLCYFSLYDFGHLDLGSTVPKSWCVQLLKPLKLTIKG